MTADERERLAQEIAAIGMRYVGASKAGAAAAAELRADGERIKALEAALRPFAKAGELFKGAAPAEFDQRIYAPAAGDEWAISGDDLRRARDVLNAARERQGGE